MSHPRSFYITSGVGLDADWGSHDFLFWGVMRTNAVTVERRGVVTTWPDLVSASFVICCSKANMVTYALHEFRRWISTTPRSAHRVHYSYLMIFPHGTYARGPETMDQRPWGVVQCRFFLAGREWSMTQSIHKFWSRHNLIHHVRICMSYVHLIKLNWIQIK